MRYTGAVKRLSFFVCVTMSIGVESVADTCNAADHEGKGCSTSSSSSSSSSNSVGRLIKLRQGGCFNSEYGNANRVNLGSSLDAVACADKVITANQECKCTPYFEFDSKTGFCGCGGVGGNECKGNGHSNGRTAAVYQFTGPSRSCTTVHSTSSQQRQPAAAVHVPGARLMRFSSNGMLYASTRKGSDETFEHAASAVLRWAAAKGDAVKIKLQRKLAHIAVTYIMTTTGEKRDDGMFLDLASTPEFDAVTAIARVLPKRITDYIDDKRTYGRVAKQAGVEGTESAVPRTFESTADALKVLWNDPAAGKYVFIKDTYGSGGTGVTVRHTADLKDVELGQHQIIQEDVTKVALVEGRRVKIRIHIIAYRGKLYLSKYWVALKHSAVFNPDNEALNSQELQQQFISQLFVQKGYRSKKEYWEKNGGFKLIAEDAPLRKEWTASIAAAVTSMIPMFNPILAATEDDPYRYHVFGLDGIPREDDSVQIIEVNPFPDLRYDNGERGDRLIDGTCFKTRMLASVIRLLFEMETEIPDDLIELAA